MKPLKYTGVDVTAYVLLFLYLGGMIAMRILMTDWIWNVAA